MPDYHFDISLSVLNHLGRNLYRSFITVICEAISNSWDADADNVWIDINRNNDSFSIKDDGTGMSSDDFQNKFLKIGYSKRRDGNFRSERKRLYIGRKGIGKLALLSCAEKITVISKTADMDYVGGTISNSDLDDAITDNFTLREFQLGDYDQSKFKHLMDNHQQGTIILFEGIRGGIKNRLEHLQKLIALYFRFSLVDDSFNIFVNGKEITEAELKSLAEKTQFLWTIGELDDPYLDHLNALKERTSKSIDIKVKGFIASVENRRDLNIQGTDEKVGVDLFVNGRLREKDILRHLKFFSTRYIASFFYGQIHFDKLDDGSDKDRFTSSREGIVEGDEEYGRLLTKLKGLMSQIADEWDNWRRKYKQDGDPENTKIPLKFRKVLELFNIIRKEQPLPEDPDKQAMIKQWLDEIEKDANFNTTSYMECFISENLVRKYIKYKGLPQKQKTTDRIQRYRNHEKKSKQQGNVHIQIRSDEQEDLNYLSMDDLAEMFDGGQTDTTSLKNDANKYKSIRNAVAHTARLTVEAKKLLTTVYDNINARLRNIYNQ